MFIDAKPAVFASVWYRAIVKHSFLQDKRWNICIKRPPTWNVTHFKDSPSPYHTYCGSLQCIDFFSIYLFLVFFWCTELCNKWNSKRSFFFPPHLLFFLSTQIKFKAKNYRQWFKLHVLIYNMEIRRTYKNVDLVMV